MLHTAIDGEGRMIQMPHHRGWPANATELLIVVRQLYGTRTRPESASPPRQDRSLYSNWGWADAASERSANPAMDVEGKGGASVTSKRPDAWTAGAHNVVTYFPNIRDLRGMALRSGEPGGGCRIGMSAMLACLLALCFHAQGSAGVFWSPRVNRERYTTPHMRHRGNRAVFANFTQTVFSEVRVGRCCSPP